MQVAATHTETPVAIRTHLGAIFVSLELSRSKWLVTSILPGAGEKMSKFNIRAGDIAALLARFGDLQRKVEARTGQCFGIISIQEAGLDGFWIHRVLEREGFESYIVDPASIATSRRRRRAKTDRQFGGHIERLIGTTMGAVHMLPGSTFSNPADRGDYRSASAARMTLRELERWIAWEIAGNYHQRIHSALNRPPIAVWREHEDKLNLRLPVDRLQFWVSFLPEDERNLRRDGIHFCNIRYWSDALAADVGQSSEKLLIKYDPRDLSRIFVRRPSGSFVEARYRDLSWPAITLAEQRAVMRLLRAQGRQGVDETLLFKTALRQREIVDAARRQTVATRRGRERRPPQATQESQGGSLKGIDSRKPLKGEEAIGGKA